MSCPEQLWSTRPQSQNLIRKGCEQLTLKPCFKQGIKSDDVKSFNSLGYSVTLLHKYEPEELHQVLGEETGSGFLIIFFFFFFWWDWLFCFQQLQTLKVYFTVTFPISVSKSNYENLRFYFIFSSKDC